MEYNASTQHMNDLGPATEQIDTSEIQGETASGVLLSDPVVNIKDKIHSVIKDITENSNHNISVNKKNEVVLPWPTRDNIPVSEFTTKNFFTLAFPALFPKGTADFHVNRPRTCSSMTDWARHLMWYKDGRFARHQIFKFIVHMILRKRALEQSNFVVNQKLGEYTISVSELKEKVNNGDNSIAEKKSYILVLLYEEHHNTGTKDQKS